MSADVLRQAAALMRSRAGKAEPGCWKLWGMSVMADPLGTSDVDDAIHVASAATPSTSERLLHTGNADHIASWNPAVALAVADWLDSEAAVFEAHVERQADPERRFNGLWLDSARQRRSHALAVARAYLNDPTP